MRLAVALVALLLQAPAPFPPEFYIRPSVTTREEALKLLGNDRETTIEWDLVYRQPGDFERAVVTFDHRDIARRVELHYPYALARPSVVSRWRLSGETARTTVDGRRVEYFLRALMSLNYAGRDEEAGVASVTRYDPGAFRDLAVKHPHLHADVADGHRILGPEIASFAVDSREQCERDCGATRACAGFTAAPAGRGLTCRLVSAVEGLVPAAAHYSVTYR